MATSRRVDHVDIAKGISIILVALFHSKLKTVIPDVIAPMGLFRLPLFFFLAGLFFSAAPSPGVFVWKKADVLLKPYFVTSLALLIVFTIDGHGNPFGLLLDILYGNGAIVRWGAMWFLTHLFAVFCFAYMLCRLTGLQDRPAAVQWGVIALMLIVGSQWVTAFWDLRVSLSGEDIVVHGLPFNSDILLLSGAFFLAGSLLRTQVLVFTPNLLWMLLALLGFAAVVLFTDAAIDFNRRVYDTPLFATIGAACGIYAVLTIAFYLNCLPGVRNAILAYGRASLFILIFHVYVGGVAFKAMTKYGPFEADNIGVLLAAFLASITIPLLIRRIVIGNAWLSLLYLPLHARRTPFWRKKARRANESPPAADRYGAAKSPNKMGQSSDA